VYADLPRFRLARLRSRSCWRSSSPTRRERTRSRIRAGG
jgi:hypothetical protein